MSNLDWIGLWAQLQVIGTIIGIVFFVIVLLVGIVYVFGPYILDMWRGRK